jgi:SAM-dependent methyltransferase
VAAGLRHDYDIITCASCLPLLKDPGAAIRHWATFLKGGGLLVVDVPSEKSQLPGFIFEGVVEEFHMRLSCSGRGWVQGPGSLADLVRSAGLEVERSFEARGYGSANDYREEDAWGLFDKLAASIAHGLFDDMAVREQAVGRFLSKWHERAGEDGVLREDEGFYIVVAKKRYIIECKQESGIDKRTQDLDHEAVFKRSKADLNGRRCDT